jgi:uncharacterized short protein YbdD (DUF466 family)
MNLSRRILEELFGKVKKPLSIEYLGYKIPYEVERCYTTSELDETLVERGIKKTEPEFKKGMKLLVKEYNQYIDRMKNSLLGRNKKLLTVNEFIKHCIPIEAFVYCQDPEYNPFVTITVGDDLIEKQFSRKFEFEFDENGRFNEEDTWLIF